MIVSDFDNLTGTDQEVSDPEGKWVSLRKFLAKDDLGYSFHRTHIRPNQEIVMEYKNHVELVSVINGFGTVTDEKNGHVHQLKPGVTYLLNQHDCHTLRSGSEGMVMHCIFTPALTGAEVHDINGSYPFKNEQNS